jgi:hypothetical protein
MTNINEWGPAAWYLFHSLANNAKKDEFPQIKDAILEQFFNMCNNLPCDECRAHATGKIRSLDVKRIKTQHDLKIMLMEFHNHVNVSNNKPVFTEKDLDEKYNKANLVNIIDYFFLIWGTRNNNSKLMSNSFYRKRYLISLKEWLNSNMNKFNV